MEYEALGPITLEEAAVDLASGDPETVSTALLRLALHHEDWSAVQERCIEFATHDDVWVRRNSATALGHLARLHRQLDTTRVVPILERLKRDPEVGSWADSALDDLVVFLGHRGDA